MIRGNGRRTKASIKKAKCEKRKRGEEENVSGRREKERERRR